MKVYEIIFDSTVPQEDIACAIKHLEKRYRASFQLLLSTGPVIGGSAYP